MNDERSRGYENTDESTGPGAPEGNSNAEGHGAPEGNTNAVGNGGGAPEDNSHAIENDGGAPKGNGNAITHGASADPWNLYEHMDDEAREWIDTLADAYADHLGLSENEPKRDLLTQAAIHTYQSRSADAKIFEQGLSEDVPVSISKSGEPVIQAREHHLNDLSLARSREARMILKDIGALNPPQQQAAESTQTLAAAIKDAVNE